MIYAYPKDGLEDAPDENSPQTKCTISSIAYGCWVTGPGIYEAYQSISKSSSLNQMDGRYWRTGNPKPICAISKLKNDEIDDHALSHLCRTKFNSHGLLEVSVGNNQVLQWTKTDNVKICGPGVYAVFYESVAPFGVSGYSPTIYRGIDGLVGKEPEVLWREVKPPISYLEVPTRVTARKDDDGEWVKVDDKNILWEDFAEISFGNFIGPTDNFRKHVADGRALIPAVSAMQVTSSTEYADAQLVETTKFWFNAPISAPSK